MTIQRGDIFFVNLNPVKGREQAGHRPVLVLSIDAINKLPLVVTVVVGTKGAKPWPELRQWLHCFKKNRSSGGYGVTHIFGERCTVFI
jgi:hypothetical protein